MRRSFALGLGVAALAAVACGSSDTEIASEGASDYEAYAKELAVLLCESGAGCCGEGFQYDLCMQFLPLMVEHPAPDKFVFHPEAAEQCLAGTRANSACGEEPEACSRVTEGLVSSGGSCRSHLECVPPGASAPSGMCDGPEGSMRCRGAASVGEACDGTCFDDLCVLLSEAGGNVCLDDLGSRCSFESGVCEATIPAGAPCTIRDLCASGLECTSGVCTPLPSAGAPCTFECAEGNYCNSGTCVPKLPAGAACVNYSECLEDVCENGACMPPTSDGGFVCLFFGAGL